MREDGLAGYPDEVEAIVAHIVERNIARIVFVSGDLHLSCFAVLSLRNADSTKVAEAVQIVVSGLYVPFSFMNTAVSAIDRTRPTVISARNHSIRYTPQFLTDAAAHFVRVATIPAGAQWAILVLIRPDAFARH